MRKSASLLFVLQIFNFASAFASASAGGIRATTRGTLQSNDAQLSPQNPDATTPYNTSSTNLCPIGSTEKVVYNIPPYKYKLTEVSYMAHSSQLYGSKAVVVWMGSDGPQNSIFAINIETGAVIRRYLLDVPLIGDWESMALGPCSSLDTTKRCLYIGNMGNNLADSCTNLSCSRGSEHVYIYKLVEPDINAYYDGKELAVTTLIISFSGSNFVTNRANSESLFVDHTGDQKGGKPGDLYFITKFVTRYDLQSLGKISVYDHESLSPGTSTPVVVNNVGSIATQSVPWTDATMNLEGNLIAVRSNGFITFFPRIPSQTVQDSLGSAACSFVSQSVMLYNQKQFEAVTFMPSPYYAEASECNGGKKCTLQVTQYKLLF